MRFFTSVHLLLLIYIIAAIVWWGISLERQNNQLYEQQVNMLRTQVDSLHDPTAYNQQLEALKHKRSLRSSAYIGEGSTYLIVILIGAVVVYTSFVRRIRLSRQQNNFMLSVTHELKSPIAAMKLNLQTLEKHQLNEDKRKQLLERCIKESNRLNDLCNNMLFASQLEGRQYKVAREPFDLSALAEYVVDDYASRYQHRRFEQDIMTGCEITGDRVMIQMAINNIVENAVKYTPEDKPVTVTLDKNAGNVVLKVTDQGAGIPDSEKKKIFNKFYRVGNEESRRSKGTGLGLYLTNKIILQHKGRIIVKNNTPSGSIFEICLPV
jgi:signal transduction histidine kinase